MDAQTQLVAELYKTLNDAQKQEVCNMIDTLLSQQLNDQQSLDSHSATTENQDICPIFAASSMRQRT